MSYFKRELITISLFLSLSTCYSQQENQNYFFQQLGWSITLPLDFSLIDLMDNRDIAHGNEETSEQYANDFEAAIPDLQTMVVAIKDRFNYFNITIYPFDTTTDGDWKKEMQSFKHLAYKTMVKNIGNGTVDTATSIKYIDGLAFEQFHISGTGTKGDKLDMFLLGKCYKGYDVAITYVCGDIETQKQIELMLKSSRLE
jgi:hypothetical protein